MAKWLLKCSHNKIKYETLKRKDENPHIEKDPAYIFNFFDHQTSKSAKISKGKPQKWTARLSLYTIVNFNHQTTSWIHILCLHRYKEQRKREANDAKERVREKIIELSILRILETTHSQEKSLMSLNHLLQATSQNKETLDSNPKSKQTSIVLSTTFKILIKPTKKLIKGHTGTGL